jgi:hypothetical protein
LDDDELQIVMRMAEPISRDRRSAFLQDVADALGTYPAVGPGLVSRVCREVQARHFDPPLATETSAPRHKARA